MNWECANDGAVVGAQSDFNNDDRIWQFKCCTVSLSCHLFYQFIFNIQNICPDLRLSYCHAEGIHNPEISRSKLVTRKLKHLKV